MAGAPPPKSKSRPVDAGTPAHIATYVDVLGIDGAVALFLSVGGSQVYLSKRSSDRTLIAQAIGADNVERLAAELGYGYIKVPLARQWIARAMRAKGKTDQHIARTVRADVATVRRWLIETPRGEQLSLPI